ncbi:MAG: aspartate/glutamate racemase family protein [Candidatus Krumholzibacteria bacterium]|nr:aspartate/glutamate racemase family protein [Candidatus Krumholzibacteria bacterium]
MAKRTIGMIGGISWASSIEYYRIINKTVQERIGGEASARLIMYSVDFSELRSAQKNRGWDAVAEMLIDIARRLRVGGADFLVMAANTVHIVADRVEAAVDMPLLHIADATAGTIRAAGMKKVGLLGTRYTMTEDFYRARLKQRHGIDVIVPGEGDIERINEIIFGELVRDVFRDESRDEVLRIAGGLVAAGAEGIVLGCTELPLLVKPGQIPAPSFDTLTLHAVAAAERAIA